MHRRPILRPGTHVLRRDEHTVQVGLDRRTAVVLADDPEVRRCLELLRAAAPVTEYGVTTTLDSLAAAGHVMDSGALTPLVPVREGPSSRPRVSRPDAAALARVAGDAAPDVLAARTAFRAGVESHGPDPALADELRTLLREAGVRVPRAGRHDAVVLVAVGEPPRELLDEPMRAGTPHLPVRLTEGTATVGPFVVPGRTACLRCVDAHLTDLDPSWPLLVVQYSSLTARERSDGVPEPVDRLLAQVALAWAARDLVTYAEGGRPSTWSATVRLHPRLAPTDHQDWLRHPACGCAWG